GTRTSGSPSVPLARRPSPSLLFPSAGCAIGGAGQVEGSARAVLRGRRAPRIGEGDRDAPRGQVALRVEERPREGLIRQGPPHRADGATPPATPRREHDTHPSWNLAALSGRRVDRAVTGERCPRPPRQFYARPPMAGVLARRTAPVARRPPRAGV